MAHHGFTCNGRLRFRSMSLPRGSSTLPYFSRAAAGVATRGPGNERRVAPDAMLAKRQQRLLLHHPLPRAANPSFLPTSLDDRLPYAAGPLATIRRLTGLETSVHSRPIYDVRDMPGPPAAKSARDAMSAHIGG